MSIGASGAGGGPGDSPAPVLYHLHIPKTAGTSLYAALAERLPPEKVCPVGLATVGLLRLPPGRLAEFDLIGGHLDFGYHLPALLGRPVLPVTLLREPRAVLLSLYKQVMQEPRDPLRAYVDEHCPTLESFFFDPELSRHLADSQTRFLGGTERWMTPELVARVRAADPAEVGPLLAEAHAAAPRVDRSELLRRAVGRLGECVSVGLAERLDESLARVCAALGWPPPAEAPRRNVSRVAVAERLPPHLLARLDQLSALDRVLYAEAVRRFDAAGPGNRGVAGREPGVI